MLTFYDLLILTLIIIIYWNISVMRMKINREGFVPIFDYKCPDCDFLLTNKLTTYDNKEHCYNCGAEMIKVYNDKKS